MRSMHINVLLSWIRPTSTSKLVSSCCKVAKPNLACRTRTTLLCHRTFTRKHTSPRPSMAHQGLNGEDLNLRNPRTPSHHLALTMVVVWQRFSNTRSLHHSTFNRCMRHLTTTAMLAVTRDHPNYLPLPEHLAHDQTRLDITTSHLVPTRPLAEACHHHPRHPMRCRTLTNRDLGVSCHRLHRRNINMCNRPLLNLRPLDLRSASATPTMHLPLAMARRCRWVIQDLRIPTLDHEHHLLRSSRSSRTARHRRLRTTSSSQVKATYTMPTQVPLLTFQWVLLLRPRLLRLLHAIATIALQFLPRGIASGRMTICGRRGTRRTRSDKDLMTMCRDHLRESLAQRSLVHRLAARSIAT